MVARLPKANDKDVYYFSHDCNARNDDKILALRSVYGLEGYAIYFMIIEILREQPTYKLPISKYTWNTLAMQMQSDCKTIENIVHDCCNEFKNENSSLLIIEDGFLYSESLLRRMEKVDNTSESRSKAANIRWEKEKQCKSNANALQMECNKKRIDKKKLDDIKQEEKKQKETKTLNTFVVPTVEEISAYCIERNNKIDAQSFIDYYEARGWMLGKVKMKSWKASVRTWEKNDYSKPNFLKTEPLSKKSFSEIVAERTQCQ